jgi:hypothetical protein
MFRKVALGFLIQPALMASASWVLMQAGTISEMGFLASSATPALVLVLAWAAVTATTLPTDALTSVLIKATRSDLCF